MNILGQIVSVLPLALVLSLPNQLLGHVPITQISSHFTHLLEAMDEDTDLVQDESYDGEEPGCKSNVPDLSEIFRPGQYVRAVVTAVLAAASTDVPAIGRTRDGTVKASRRVELSLSPDRVNSGVQRSDLRPGFVCAGSKFLSCSVYIEPSFRRCQQPLRVLKTMATFLILGCPMFLDF